MLIGLWVIMLLGGIGLFINQNNILIVLMCLELMLFSINLQFIYISLILNEMQGFIVALVILALAATEAAIGLGIVIIYYRVRQNISINNLFLLKG